jgi:1,4-dihydroxy-2-naphthoate octaprenyltransferase
MKPEAPVAPPTKLRAWVLACRPKTLPAAIAPVALGSACAAAAGAFRWQSAACALVFALLVQIVCNVANDLGDFVRGGDTPRRLGPARMAATGALSPGEMRVGVAVLSMAAFCAGLPLALAHGWWLVPVGVVCLAAALAYTSGPLPLAYNGLGDVFVLVFFGFVAVLFTARVQCGGFPISAWLCGLACGVLAVNILVVNNARDMDTDALAGKRTTVVLFGRGFARGLYLANFAVAMAVPLALLCATGSVGTAGGASTVDGVGVAGSVSTVGSVGGLLCVAERAWVLLPLLLAWPAAALVRGFWRVREPAAYNAFLGKTAAFLLGYALLLAAGVAWGA